MGFLDGRVALVTAGGGMLGGAMSRAFAREGAAVTVSDLDIERAGAVVSQIEKEGGRALAVAADVSRLDHVERLVEETVSTFGGLNILINHAGIGRTPLIENMSDKDWHDVVALNLDGTFYCTRAAIPHLRAAGWGRVISTASRAAYRAGPASYARGISAYAATKAGVIGFSRAAAVELGKFGITVNVIAPGPTRSADREPENPDQIAMNVIHPIRSAVPEEIAAGALYLVGPGSDQTTGQVLHINGGGYFNA